MTTMKTLFAKILGIAGSVFDFFIPILRKVTADGLAELLPLALEIVTALASQKISGEKKFDTAVKRLTARAQQLGIEASASIINFAVEAAVQKLKEGGK